MLRLPIQAPVGVVLLLLAQLLLPTMAIPPASAQTGGDLFVYHQLTNLPEETGSRGYPVLSGDGTVAVFSEAPGTGDPATPNRIFTISVTISAADTVLGVGLAALMDGTVDPNVSPGLLLLDDGQNGDAAAGDGVYTAAGITHSAVTIRDDDTGPRGIRIAAEVEEANGRRHATALDIGELTVENAAART